MPLKALKQRHIDQPTAVSDHFTLPGHSIKSKTLEPYGMNRRDET